ncbi:hypothetical protein NC653_033459 [Populus alba x Populus x berolinensis]|uniref:Uncharacterized protein n=1 Tax=Populus alba x Populus x berolinensis TaxID=444605 RepID=A0AAD6PZB1_9ROSI|nr:hypothetical protein NC653_033459 [Populus alba x Populus x berolinensis]
MASLARVSSKWDPIIYWPDVVVGIKVTPTSGFFTLKSWQGLHAYSCVDLQGRTRQQQEICLAEPIHVCSSTF